MIDIENAKKEFNNYVSQFNPDSGRIKLKIDHILRVTDLSRMLATNLKLDEEHIRLAEIIGLFHDIGRFKQVEIYDTFSDKDSINHAELSVKVLYTDNLIEKFNIDKKYHKIIKYAILNHNKGKIEDGLTDEELLYSKIIRDADKLDIYYAVCEYDFESIFWYKSFDCEKISDIIINQFTNLHYINYSDIKTNADQIVAFYAYIYDFYFNFSFQYLKSKKYLEKITDRMKQHFCSKEIALQLNKIFKICNDYINSI